MASLEIVALDTVTPQLRAPGAGDSYSIPRDMIQTTTGLGYWNQSASGYGMGFATGSGLTNFYANSRLSLAIEGAAPYGINVDYRVGLGAGTATADVGIERIAVKVLKITDGGTALTSGSGVINLPAFTVATLPTAANAGVGGRSSVSDATQTFASANFGVTVTGGGANFVPVVSDGTNWRIG